MIFEISENCTKQINLFLFIFQEKAISGYGEVLTKVHVLHFLFFEQHNADYVYFENKNA